MSRRRAVGQENSLFPVGVSVFILVRPSAARMGPTLRRRGVQLHCSSHPQTPSQTHPRSRLARYLGTPCVACHVDTYS